MKKMVRTREQTLFSMIIVILFAVVLLSACATEPVTREVWSKPNATQQDFAKDKYDCMKDAQRLTNQAQGANVSAGFGQAGVDEAIDVDRYNACMEARGWTLKEIKSIPENAIDKKTYTFADGTKYEGDMVNGKMHGRGIYTWANGNQYEGDWVNGKMSGKGKYTCHNGRQFTGNFENNKPAGFAIKCDTQSAGTLYAPGSAPTTNQKLGSYTDANGNKFEGPIVNGKLHGKGTITSPSGNKYEGDVVNGKINGRGTYTCSNGKKFTGNFKNNKPVGFSVKCN